LELILYKNWVIVLPIEGGIVDTESIEKKYEKFNIPVEKIPSNDNDPDTFIGQYKKCSILTYGNITYSNHSVRRPAD